MTTRWLPRRHRRLAGRPIAALLILSLLGPLLAAVPALAFKTFRAFGGAVHEGITREAIGGEITAEAFEIIDGASTSQDNPAGQGFTNPTHHFCDNRLGGSRAYVDAEFDSAVDDAGDADTNADHRVSALAAFGLMLHTIQDLYAHSNYIELMLQSGVPAGGIQPIDWDNPPDGLRTGYFYYSSLATNELTLPRETSVWRLHAEYPKTRFATRAQRNALRGDWDSYEGAIAYACSSYDVLHFETDKDNAGEYEGAVVEPGSGRTLFDIARGVAVAETRRQWQRMLQAIRDKYGLTRASKIIAALTGKKALTVELSADKPEVDAGQKVSVVAKASGGVPPYKYGWLVDDLPESSSASTLTVPIPAGPHTIHVDVTDSDTPAHAGSATITVTGTAEPLTLDLVPDQFEIDLDHKMKMTAKVSGGIAPYTYAWSFNGSEMSNLTSHSLTWAPTTGHTAPGHYPFTVTVTDSDKPPASATAEVTITVKPPQLAPLQVTLGADRSSIAPGDNVTVTAKVTGGTAPYKYAWTLNGNAQPHLTKSAIVWTTQKNVPPGDSTFTVEVTDSANPPTTTTAEATITVKPPQLAPLQVTLGADHSSIAPGDQVTVAAKVTGGLKPYHYDWTFNGGPAPYLTGAASNWHPTKSDTPGNYAFSVTVTDSANPPNSKTASKSIHLNALQLDPLRVTLGAGRSSIAPGDQVTVAAKVTGGLKPYHYDWTFNGGPAPYLTGAASNWHPTKSDTPGNYAFSVTVTDSANPPNTKTAAATITLTPASVTSKPPPPARQLDPWVGLWRGTGRNNNRPDGEGGYYTEPAAMQIKPYGDGYLLMLNGSSLGVPENYHISRQGVTMQISYQGPNNAKDQHQISFSFQATLHGDTRTGRLQESGYWSDAPINWDYSFTLQRAAP